MNRPPRRESVPDFVSEVHADVVGQVADAIGKHKVVVVGMAQNPHVRRARKALTKAGVSFEYLQFGSYLSMWKPRLAIKMWTGFPTFPQVFVDGELIGGADEAQAWAAQSEQVNAAS